MAVDNAVLYRARSEEARLLQESLLPPRTPDIPGLDVVARYHPVGEGTEVGGDFYDIFRAGSNRWGAVIGDVSGKGVGAASLTALARYTARAAAQQGSRRRDVLALLNRTILDADAGERFCTIAQLAVVPTGTGARLVVSVGGHPLPLVLAADGRIVPLGRPGTGVGLIEEPELRDDDGVLAPGDAVVVIRVPPSGAA